MTIMSDSSATSMNAAGVYEPKTRIGDTQERFGPDDVPGPEVENGW